MVCYDEEFVNASHLEMTEDMHSRTPIIHLTTGRNASKAMPIQFAHWQLIDWERARCIVKKLQRRIVKAVLIMAASSHLRLSMLERYEAKVSRTVLRGGRGSNPPDLPDFRRGPARLRQVGRNPDKLPYAFDNQSNIK